MNDQKEDEVDKLTKQILATVDQKKETTQLNILLDLLEELSCWLNNQINGLENNIKFGDKKLNINKNNSAKMLAQVIKSKEASVKPFNIKTKVAINTYSESNNQS